MSALTEAPCPAGMADLVVAVFGGRHRPSCPLSERERHILSLLAEGLSRKEVALELCCPEMRIVNEVTDACDKLGATTQTHAVVIALERDWI